MSLKPPASYGEICGLGADYLLHGRVEGLDDDITVRASGTVDSEMEKVELFIEQSRVWFFDPKSGRRIRH
jgi:hypothetical protein